MENIQSASCRMEDATEWRKMPGMNVISFKNKIYLDE